MQLLLTCSQVLEQHIEQAEKKRKLVTQESRDDICSMIIGFEELCNLRISQGHFVRPSFINSEIVENIFCQERTMAAANTNPDVHLYQSNLTSVILCENIISSHSNCGGAESFHFASSVSESFNGYIKYFIK